MGNIASAATYYTTTFGGSITITVDTPENITVSNAYPDGNIYDMQPTIVFTLNSRDGSNMNYVLYDESMNVLATLYNVPNGTYHYSLLHNAHEYNTPYNWSILTSEEADGDSTLHTYNYTIIQSTGGGGGSINMMGEALGASALLCGLIALVFSLGGRR